MNKQYNFHWLRLGLFTFAIILISLFACRKNSFKLRDTTEGKKEIVDPCFSDNEVDRYICDSWVSPYNISVKYRFDDLDVGDDNIGIPLVPPRDSLVIPVLRAIKKAWLDVYASVAGDGFVRRLAPKQIVLVGSKRWNSDGTVVLGVAEGGKRILLFNINEFDLKKNFDAFIKQIHTIHHEFGHILHQHILYPPAYRTISSPGDYTAQWINVRQPDNLPKGFVTPYSMLNSDEDFVETLSNSLVFRRDTLANRAEKKVEKVDKDLKGAKLLEEKQTFIENYLRDSWNLEYKQIEDSVQNALRFLKNGGNTTQPSSGGPTVDGLPYPY